MIASMKNIRGPPVTSIRGNDHEKKNLREAVGVH